MIRFPLLAAALFAAMPAGAATLTGTVDAAQFDFDGTANELSGIDVEITGGDLAGSLLTLFFVIDDPDFSSIEIAGAFGTPVELAGETQQSLTVSALLDRDFDATTAEDLVELTITGFGFNRNVTEALRLVPDGVFAAADMVQPIPLPAAAWLLGSGLVALGGLRAARRQKQPA